MEKSTQDAAPDSSETVRPAYASVEKAVQRLMLVVIPPWMLSMGLAAVGKGSAWSAPFVFMLIGLVMACYVIFLRSSSRSPWLLVGPLAVMSLILAASSPVGLTLEGTPLIELALTVTSFAIGALLPWRRGLPVFIAVLSAAMALEFFQLTRLEVPVMPVAFMSVALWATLNFAALVGAIGVLRSTAIDADRTAALRAAASADQERERAGQSEFRRLIRLLHDTVVNTLGAIHSWPQPDVAAVRARCRADLELLRRVDADGGHLPANVLDSARNRAALLGLDLDVQVQCLGPRLEPEVAGALEGASWEILNNVAKHSGCSDASLLWSWDGRDGFVEIADQGVGFPGSSRLAGGSHESVTRRCAEAGVAVRVASLPGSGTRVGLSWRGQQASAPSQMAPAPTLVNRELDQVMARVVLRISAVVAVLGAVSTWQLPVGSATWGGLGALLIVALVIVFAAAVSMGRTRISRVPIIVYPAATLFAALLPGFGLYGCDKVGRWWWGPLAALSVAAAATLMDRRRAALVLTASAYLVGITVAILTAGPGTGSCITEAWSTMIVDLGVMGAMYAFRGRLTRTWQTARDEHEALESVLRGSARDAELLRIRMGLLDFARQIAEPLLSGLASGELDPLDESTRERCGRTESTLRALSSLPLAAEADGVAAVLAEVVLAAHRRDIQLHLNLTSDALPDDSRSQAVRRLLDDLLQACPTGGSAQVTFLRLGDQRRFMGVIDVGEDVGDGPVEFPPSTGWSMANGGNQALLTAVWTGK